MNEITYAGQPLVDAPGTCFVLPWGPTPGHGVFDVDARAFSRIQEALELADGAADLVMTCGTPALGCGVTLKDIYLLSAEPVITRRGGVATSQGVASWRITLEDRRHVLAMRTISGRYNILKPDREKYFADTANGSETNPWTWQEIVDSLGGALGLDLDLAATPAGNPADVVWDSDAPLELLHELLAEVGQYLTYEPLSGTASDWNIHQIGAPDADEVRALNDLLRTARMEGASAIRATRALAPASVDVCFPIHDTALADQRTDADDRWYKVNKAAPQTLKTTAGSKGSIFYNHAWALREGATVTNAAALGDIATARAAEFYAQFEVEHADYELAGLHAIAPNSVIRRVIWVSDEGGARTLVRVHNPSLHPVGARHASPATTEGRATHASPLQEGEGAFLQRGPRPRIEAERTGFFSVIQSQVGATAEYKVRRVRQDLGYIGAEFSAWDLDGDTTRESAMKVLVQTDGEGKYVFLPFEEGPILIDSWAVVHELGGTGVERHPLNAVFGAGGGAPTDDEWLLIRLQKATPVRAISRVLMLFDHDIRWEFNDEFEATTVAPTLAWTMDYIVEDFDPATVDWADAQALAYAGGEQAGEAPLITLWTHNVPGVNAELHCHDSALVGCQTESGAWDAETLIYGLRLRITTMSLGFNATTEPSIVSGAATFTLDEDQSAFIY